jgi:hypothetical protein
VKQKDSMVMVHFSYAHPCFTKCLPLTNILGVAVSVITLLMSGKRKNDYCAVFTSILNLLQSAEHSKDARDHARNRKKQHEAGYLLIPSNTVLLSKYKENRLGPTIQS